MKINDICKGLALAGGLMLMLWLVMPTERIEQLTESLHRFRGDPATLCLDYERLSLTDPSAARLRRSARTSRDDITIVYSAKNAYGAYVSAEAVCTVRDNKVDSSLTQAARTIDHLDKHLACLAAKKRDREADRSGGQARYEDCTRGLMPMK